MGVSQGHPLDAAIPVLGPILVWRVPAPTLGEFVQQFVLPLARYLPNRRFLIQLRGLFAGRAELTVGEHATGEQVVHQAGFDLLVLGD